MVKDIILNNHLKMKIKITPDTLLSDLFRRTFYEDLRQVINSWRSFLTDNDPSVDALQIKQFHFDKKRITAQRIYMDLISLIERGALRPSMQTLADYLFEHTNLSKSASALYQLLARYRREWEKCAE